MDSSVPAVSLCRGAGTERCEEILTLGPVYLDLAPTALHNSVSTYDLFIT
jgi:hypothetical protein